MKFGVWMLMLFIQDFREIYIFTKFWEHIFYVDFIH